MCSYCFCFIGSVEAQIGRRLYLQSLGIYGEKECEKEHPIHSTNDKMERDFPPKEMIESLLNGDLSLPFTNQFELPEAVPCPGGCEEEQYCRLEEFLSIYLIVVMFLSFINYLKRHYRFLYFGIVILKFENYYVNLYYCLYSACYLASEPPF